MKKIAILFLFCPILSHAQLTKQDSLWLPFKSCIGKWMEVSEGQSGSGKYERSYEVVLNRKFIEVRNKSIYPPSRDNPAGEVHVDHGFINHDKSRKTFVLRQFHIEGFVNQYRVDSISPEGKNMVFISEAIENIPSGRRAKETYKIISTNEFSETFELAEPGKDFEVYSKAILKRVQ